MRLNEQKHRRETQGRLEQLYLAYRHLMFYVAYSTLHDIPLAEDAVRQAFVRAQRHIDKIPSIHCPQTKNFLIVVVKNIAIHQNHLRHKRDTVTFDEVDGWVCAERDEPDQPQSTQRLSDLMKLLPESYRDVLMLRYDNRCSAAEIADLLDSSEENIRKRIRRARARLADQIAKGETDG